MSFAEPAGSSRLATSPWMTLCPLGTLEIDARAIDDDLSDQLKPDLPVVLIDQRPFSRRRLRRLARELAIAVEREFIVLPTLGRPIVLIDDTEAAVRHFWTTIATVPPGLALSAVPASALLSLARRLPWSWTGAAAPGRALVGRRP
ncbi:hypothetical protein GCM10009554_43310 [Kribbella koreensis]|uniref:Uncharacterized protein n=1 Tax=Kribbella koreensis TaxID=57909 RepID=A0ABP4B6Y5_9ACTN